MVNGFVAAADDAPVGVVVWDEGEPGGERDEGAIEVAEVGVEGVCVVVGRESIHVRMVSFKPRRYDVDACVGKGRMEKKGWVNVHVQTERTKEREGEQHIHAYIHTHTHTHNNRRTVHRNANTCSAGRAKSHTRSIASALPPPVASTGRDASSSLRNLVTSVVDSTVNENGIRDGEIAQRTRQRRRRE
jgi:hypothetical protein